MELWKLEGREGQGWDAACLEGRGRGWRGSVFSI